MATNVNDPMSRLGWLLDPSTPLPDTDTAAAEGAVASGGMVGSPFAANSRLRLRDKERLDRLQIGEAALQPYLNRASSESIAAGNQSVQREQIAQQAASDALRQAGLDRRLSAEGQQRLQLALITGDQQAAHDTLLESGQNSRQAASIAAGLRQTTLNNQNSLLQSLLPYALPKAGTSSGSGAAPGMQGNPIMGTNGRPYTGPVPTSGTNWGAQGRSSGSSGTLNAQLGPVLSRILAGYGL